jgi:Zn-dependent protease
MARFGGILANVNGSIQIGSVLGIKIRVHVLLLLLLGLLVLGSEDASMAFLVAVTTFAIVLLHELAHSVVAMRFGLRVLDITLWPLGGMARMSDIPESTRIEGWIAVAGPLLNYVLAVIALPFVVWLHPWSGDPSRIFARWSLYFLGANVLIGTFNLLPAFPMDGGRILRAFLGRKGDWVLATERAVNVGRAVALLLAIAGCFGFRLFGMQSVMWLLIAIFVWWAGTQELFAVRARHGLDPLAIFRAYAAGMKGWNVQQPASEFARAQASPGEAPPVSGQAQGFTNEELERLERFRGPLRNYPPEST